MRRVAKTIPYRWVVAFILFLAYSMQHLDRVKTSVFNPSIMKDIGLTASDVGTGVFLMMIFYGPAQLLSGILADKFGAKRVLIFSIIAWSIMTGWMGFIKTPNQYFLRMALFGILIGTQYVPSASILMRWFNRDGRARAQALLSWAWILTPAWAGAFATYLAIHCGGWRPVFFLTAAMGLIPLVLIIVCVFDKPEDYKDITREELECSYRDELQEGILTKGELANAQTKILSRNRFEFLDLFRHRLFIPAMVVDVTIHIAYWGMLIWIPIYLSDRLSFKISAMGFWSALYFISGALGCFASAYLSDKLFRNDRRVMILVSFIGLLPFILLLASLKTAFPVPLALALCGIGFFANMPWGPFLATPAEIFTPEVYGKTMGFINGIGYFIAAVAVKIFGTLVAVQADGTKDYSSGWVFLALCVLIGIIAVLFLRGESSVKPVVPLVQSP
jgi:sugar phosphate permease